MSVGHIAPAKMAGADKAVAKAPRGAVSGGGFPAVRLQHEIGNQAIQSLFKSGALQARLAVGAPADPLEEEAERTADAVMRAPSDIVRRQCACGAAAGASGECSECGQNLAQKSAMPILRRRPDGGGASSEAPAMVHRVLGSPGRPLEHAPRAFMEARFGRDFGDVRIHTDQRAAQSAEAIDALAYTVGNNVVFGRGQYAPNSSSGRRLLAHELAHVVQANPRAVIRRQARTVSSGGGSGTVRARGQHAPPAYMQRKLRDPVSSGTCPACAGSAAPCTICGSAGQTQIGAGGDPWAGPPAPAPAAPQAGQSGKAGPAGPAAPGISGGGVWPLRLVLDHFAFDKSVLIRDHWDKIEALSKMIYRLPSGAVQLEVIGHTDATGTESYNVGLSDRRADAVADAIGLRTGIAVTRTGHGKREPIADDSTEEGRARNRRAEIRISPGTVNWTPPVPTPVPVPQPTPGPTPGPQPPDTDPFFCLASPWHFALCAAGLAGAATAILEGLSGLLGGVGGILGGLGGILGGLGGILAGLLGLGALSQLLPRVRRVLDCLAHPKQCVLGPDDDDPKKQEEKKEPPPDHACLALHGRYLPDGDDIHVTSPRLFPGSELVFVADFRMGLTFRNAPDEGCACYCGEYLQEIRGLFEWYDGTMWRHTPHEIRADGTILHETIWQEDGGINPVFYYGHRAPGVNTWTDSFEPDRATGCEYRGFDQPGLRRLAQIPYPRRFSLYFRGAPVDSEACGGRSLARGEGWSYWHVWGEYTPPQPPTPTTPTTPTTPSGPTTATGPQLATPLSAGLAVEIEQQWRDDPYSLCLDDQIGCGTATFVDELRRRGTSLTGVLRDTALAREVEALDKHCDLMHQAILESNFDSLEALAGRRLDNFLRWGERVGEHRLREPCP